MNLNSFRRTLSATLLAMAAFAMSPVNSYAKPDTKPAENKAADTKPSAEPASKPAGDEFAKITRGDLVVEVRAEAPFQPIDSFEVKPEFKGYQGPLVITSIVEQGTLVRKDQPLITFDRTWIDWGLTAATNELAAAKANLTKAQIDARLAEESDKLALRQAEDALRNVEAGKKWFEDVDGPQMLQIADLNVKQSQNSVDDQTDELDQLKKMYAGEELTTATADIVVRRALRSLEQSKVVLKIQQDRADKTKTFDYPVQRQRVLDAVTQASTALQSLKAAQAQSAVARIGGLQAAQIAVEQAEKKLADLKADAEQFQTKATADGVVGYGAMVDGVLSNADPKSLEVGDKVTAGQVLIRVYQPNKLRLVVNVPETQAFWVDKGDKARVTPGSLPQISYVAETSAVELQTKAQGMVFAATIDLENPDSRLVPGMKAAVVIEAGKIGDVLLAPLSAVVDGKVKVKDGDGEVVEKSVKVGQSDGKIVEIRSGLAEGDEVKK